MEERTFGNWLKGQRLQRGLSQGKLARAIDIDRSYVSRIESGNIVLPGIEFRERFHEFFGTEEQDLIDLGIVKQYDQWGREITRSAPATIALAQEFRPVYDDDDAPLTPDEEAIFINLVFRGYAEMTNAQKRMIINATKQALNEGS